MPEIDSFECSPKNKKNQSIDIFKIVDEQWVCQQMQLSDRKQFFTMVYTMINDGFIQSMGQLSQLYEHKNIDGYYHLCKQLVCMASYVGASRLFYVFDKIIKLRESSQQDYKIWDLYPTLVEYIQEYVQFLSFEYFSYCKKLNKIDDDMVSPETFH